MKRPFFYFAEKRLLPEQQPKNKAFVQEDNSPKSKSAKRGEESCFSWVFCINCFSSVAWRVLSAASAGSELGVGRAGLALP